MIRLRCEVEHQVVGQPAHVSPVLRDKRGNTVRVAQVAAEVPVVPLVHLRRPIARSRRGPHPRRDEGEEQHRHRADGFARHPKRARHSYDAKDCERDREASRGERSETGQHAADRRDDQHCHTDRDHELVERTVAVCARERSQPQAGKYEQGDADRGEPEDRDHAGIGTRVDESSITRRSVASAVTADRYPALP